jgi:hypothetical protein
VNAGISFKETTLDNADTNKLCTVEFSKVIGGISVPGLVLIRTQQIRLADILFIHAFRVEYTVELCGAKTEF